MPARTAPERIRWPRDGKAATLVVRCDPSLALQFPHETDRVRERLNAYFGYPAVGAVKIVQQPVGAAAEAASRRRPPARAVPAALAEKLTGSTGRSASRSARSARPFSHERDDLSVSPRARPGLFEAEPAPVQPPFKAPEVRGSGQSGPDKLRKGW